MWTLTLSGSADAKPSRTQPSIAIVALSRPPGLTSEVMYTRLSPCSVQAGDRGGSTAHVPAPMISNLSSEIEKCVVPVTVQSSVTVAAIVWFWLWLVPMYG